MLADKNHDLACALFAVVVYFLVNTLLGPDIALTTLVCLIYGKVSAILELSHYSATKLEDRYDRR